MVKLLFLHSIKYLLLLLLIFPSKLKDEYIFEVELTKKQDITITEELKCLADNIYHESKGESLKGKLGVAQTTLNRTKNENFPSNICNVVYQRNKKVCQFSWVCKKVNVVYDESYYDSLIIANAVLYDGLSDNIFKKSLFFHADYVKPKWKKRKITKIGKHIFYE